MTTSGHASTWNDCETWSRDQIHHHQLAALRAQLQYVNRFSTHYRDQWAGLGWDPQDVRGLNDLRQLPVTTKADYVQSLAEAPYRGKMVAADAGELRRVHYSSGTSSDPTPVFWTQSDLDRWADLYARGAHSQGITRDDVYQCLFGFSWFVGGLGAIAGYQRLGCLCIPGGAGDSVRQLQTIDRMGTTAIAGTPSFLLHLAEVAEEAGISLRDSPVRAVMTGGEPGAALAGVRSALETAWGAKAYDGYGCIEFQPIAWECSAQAGGHLAEDFALAEIVDPVSLDAVPDGSPGVLVLTHLDKQASPLVRWWTGDVVVRDSSPCSCGRTMSRLPGGVRGRADDMLVIRGVNLFPSAVENIVRELCGNVEFRIVIDASVTDPATGYLTGFRLEVEEASTEVDLAGIIRQRLLVRPTVHRVPLGSLPRSTHKSQRLVHEL